MCADVPVPEIETFSRTNACVGDVPASEPLRTVTAPAGIEPLISGLDAFFAVQLRPSLECSIATVSVAVPVTVSATA